jgi:hypothetical protein
MRLSRLGTDTSPQHEVFGAASELDRSILGSAEQLPAHQPIEVLRRPFKKPPLAAESGGPTREGCAVGDESASRNRKFESSSLQLESPVRT